MKKTLLLLVCVSIAYLTMAQEPAKQKEVGLVFSSLNNFGLTYKTGTDKSLWRFNTLYLSGTDRENIRENIDYTITSMGFGVKIGKEYRKDIGANLELRYGADLSFGYSYNKAVTTYQMDNVYESSRVQKIYSPGVNLVFGLNYLISENLILGAEILPYFTYKTGTYTQQVTNPIIGNEMKADISGFSYGVSTSSVLLSFVYRF